jgi:hypothetical protein
VLLIAIAVFGENDLLVGAVPDETGAQAARHFTVTKLLNGFGLQIEQV